MYRPTHLNRQAAAHDNKNYGITPSRDSLECCGRPLKDCLWDETGRQSIPKGLSEKQDENEDEEPHKGEDDSGSRRGRDPRDGDDQQLKQPDLPLKSLFSKEPGKLEPGVTPKVVFSNLQRLEHGQLQYFLIHANGPRQHPLRTEYHSYPDTFNCTYENCPKMSVQEMHEHVSQNPDMQKLKDRWLRGNRWRNVKKNLVMGGKASLGVGYVVFVVSLMITAPLFSALVGRSMLLGSCSVAGRRWPQKRRFYGLQLASV